ncbi:MAG: hypothetical protein JNM00_00675 [Flavobacteriales bacterium]|nr:hypothetical protein [Flavobacteriales bacterium]
MTANKQSSNRRLLHLSMLLLALYNLLYWPAKLFSSAPNWVKSAYEVIKANWGTFMVLEFFLIASLFADMIIRFDTIDKKKRTTHLLLVAVFICCFVLRFIFGVMEKYITGVLK